MHPQLDLVDQYIRLISWPTLLSMVVWVVRKWDKGQAGFAEMSANTKRAVETVSIVKQDVDIIKSNHLAHLQDGITQVAASNQKAVEVLYEIKSGIDVLVDRTPRV